MILDAGNVRLTASRLAYRARLEAGIGRWSLNLSAGWQLGSIGPFGKYLDNGHGCSTAQLGALQGPLKTAKALILRSPLMEPLVLVK